MPFTEAKGSVSAAPAKVGRYGIPVIEDGPKFEGTDVCVANLFRYWERTHNLYCFLDDFPSVSAEQAIEAINENMRVNANEVIHSNGEIMSGAPVFKGTRLTVKSLFDYLAGGYSLDEFLDSFPSGDREQAVKTLDAARRAIESIAYETAAR